MFEHLYEGNDSSPQARAQRVPTRIMLSAAHSPRRRIHFIAQVIIVSVAISKSEREVETGCDFQLDSWEVLVLGGRDITTANNSFLRGIMHVLGVRLSTLFGVVPIPLGRELINSYRVEYC